MDINDVKLGMYLIDISCGHLSEYNITGRPTQAEFFPPA